MFKNGLGLYVCLSEADVVKHDTLVYHTSDGFCYVRPVDDNAGSLYDWHAICAALPIALTEARAAGLNPTACYVLGK